MRPQTILFLFPFLLVAGCAASEPSPPPPVMPISFAMVAVSDGTLLAGDTVDRQMLPASTAKLVTALAVLDRLPAKHRFETKLCRDGDTIRLIGGGDPTLDVEDLFALALAAGEGLRGADAFTFFPSDSTGPIQPAQPSDAAYNPSLSDLMVAEGAYRGQGGEEGWTVPTGAPVPAAEGLDWYAHPDPPRQAADLFHDYATGLGIELPGPIPGDNACPMVLSSVRSEGMAALVREMLWTSSNPMAEMLGQQALDRADPADWLREAHPDLTGIALTNFSGLDARARVTAGDMAHLLARAAKTYPGFPSVLTPAGWDGGLRNRLIAPPLALSVWAKTGTMHYGVGLAGYALIPGRGLVAIAYYAFDPQARAAHDPRQASEAEEAQARAWITTARAAIDAALERAFKALMEAPKD